MNSNPTNNSEVQEKLKHVARAIEHQGHILFMSTSMDPSNPDSTIVHVNAGNTIKVWLSRVELPGDEEQKAKAILEYLNEISEHVDGDYLALPHHWHTQQEFPFVDTVYKADPRNEKARSQLYGRLNKEDIDLQSVRDRDVDVVDCYNILVSDEDFRRTMLDIYRRHPWLVRHTNEKDILSNFEADGRSWHKYIKRNPDEAVKWLIDNGMTSLKVGVSGAYYNNVENVFKRPIELHAVRALAGLQHFALDTSYATNVFLDVISALPPEWASDWCRPENIEAAKELSSICALPIVNSRKDVRRLLASSKGNVQAYGDDINCKVREACDFLRSFHNEISAPVLGIMKEQKLNENNLSDFQTLDTEARRFNAEITRKMLGFEGLGKVLELSAKWHRTQAEIRAKISLNMDRAKWPGLIENYQAKNGLLLVPLTTPKQLENEGKVGRDDNGMLGLNHCVGSFYGTCLAGESHIISVRRRNGKAWERVSTIEYKIDRDQLVQVQHHGTGNSKPADEAVTAVKEFEDLALRRKVPLNIEEIARHKEAFRKIPIHDNREKLERGLDGWKPLLKREYRNISVDDVVQKMFDLNIGASNYAQQQLAAFQVNIPRNIMRL